MRISRIYNNNVVLTVDHYGKESVMIGRGIAFGKRKGQLIDPSAVEQTFVPEQGMSGERLSMTPSEIPAEILSIATLLESKVRVEGCWSYRTRLFFRWLITCTMRWFVRVMEFGWSIRLPRR